MEASNGGQGTILLGADYMPEGCSSVCVISRNPHNHPVKLVCYPEAQKGEVTCLGSQNEIQISGLLNPELVFSSITITIFQTLFYTSNRMLYP